MRIIFFIYPLWLVLRGFLLYVRKDTPKTQNGRLWAILEHSKVFECIIYCLFFFRWAFRRFVTAFALVVVFPFLKNCVSLLSVLCCLAFGICNIKFVKVKFNLYPIIWIEFGQKSNSFYMCGIREHIKGGNIFCFVSVFL